jgi:hypothetical protein
LRFFLFEEATESVDEVGGTIGIIGVARAFGGAAGTTKAGFEQVGGGASNVRNKLGILGGAFDQEGDGGAAFLAAALAAKRGAEEIAGSGTAVADGANRAACKSRGHFEIEIVFSIHGALAYQSAKSGKDGVKILRAQAVRRHVDVRGQLLDDEIFSSLKASERGDGRHFRAEIEAFEGAIVETKSAVGDELVRGALDIQIGVEGSRSERSALRNIDADGGKKSFQIPGRHVIADKLHIHDGSIALRRVRAIEMSGGAADFDRRGIDDAAIFHQIVPGAEIHSGGNRGRRTTFDQEGFGKSERAFSGGFAVLRSERGVHIHEAAETEGRIEEASGSEIETVDFELSVKRSQGSVGLIQGTDGAVEGEFSARGKIGGDSNGKLRVQGKVRGGDVHIVVGAALSGVGRANGDLAVLEFELANGDGHGRTRGTLGGRRSGRPGARSGIGGSRRGGRLAEGGIVPLAGGIADQSDLGRVNGEAGDAQRFVENERQDFNTNADGFGGEKRRRTEFGIVGDREILRAEGTGDERQAEIADFDLAAERRGGLRFDHGTKLINGNKERQDKQENDDDADDDEDVTKGVFHDDLRGRGMAVRAWSSGTGS